MATIRTTTDGIPRYFYTFSVKRKLTRDKNLLQPEPTPNRTTPLPRATNRTHVVQPVQPKLSDFTEDPFRDYRYEDPFNITDPFAEEAGDTNANKSSGIDIKSGTMVDPFGFRTISAFSSKNTSAKVFDNDFTNTFPLAKAKNEKSATTTNKFDADFGKAFSTDNRNARIIDTTRFPHELSFSNVKMKTVDLDEAFSTKNAKTVVASDALKSKNIYNDEKLANDFGKMWNGNNVTNLSEEEQVAWAQKQSMKAEEERLKRKEKEDADLALAIELSKVKSDDN